MTKLDLFALIIKNNLTIRLPKLLVFSCLTCLTVSLIGCGTTKKEMLPQSVAKKNSYVHATVPVGYHRVRSGENLYKISVKYHTSVGQLSHINHLSDPAQIKAGQLIKVKDNSGAKKRTTTSPGYSTNSKIINSILNHMNFAWPTQGSVVTYFNGSTNKGIDILTTTLAPIRAVQNGQVIYSDYVNGYGNLILISHNAKNSILSVYANNQDVKIKLNQEVQKGQIIATVGNNASNQPVLHFEIRYNSTAINPLPYLHR